MPLSLEDALLTVYQQSLVENRKTVLLEDKSFPVRVTAKRKLKQVDFQYDGKDLRGLEQNPETKSRWAAMARRERKKKPAIPVGMTALKRSGPTLATTKGARVGHPPFTKFKSLGTSSGHVSRLRRLGHWRWVTQP